MSASASLKLSIERAPAIAWQKWLTFTSIAMADVAAILCSGIIIISLRHFAAGRIAVVEYVRLLPMLVLFLSAFTLASLYPGVPANPIREFRRILGATSVTYLVMFGASLFLRAKGSYPVGILAVGWLVTSGLVIACREVVRMTCSRASWWGVPTVIFCNGRTGRAMVEELRRSPALGLRPVALLDQDTPLRGHTDRRLAGLAAGDFSHASAIAQESGGCYAIIALPDLTSDKVAGIMSEYASEFSHVFVVPDCFGMSSLWASATEIGGVLGFQVNQALAHHGQRALKRAFDLFFVAGLALPLSPLLVLLYVLVRMSSPGPVFYGQRRIGRGDQPFTAWKFRTMVPNAEQVLEAHLNADPELHEEWRLNQKLRRDPRVTTIGRFLRKTSLDELPQLWNVFRGEMSFVGPRPIVRAEIARYGRRFELYRKVAPGITGMWQISGRNNTTYDERTRLDEYYVRNWSVCLDLYILYRTIKTVLLTEGAY